MLQVAVLPSDPLSKKHHKSFNMKFFEKHRNFSSLQVLIHILFSLATRFIHKIDVVNDRGECGVKLIKK